MHTMIVKWYLHRKDCIAQDTEEAFPINCSLLFLTVTKILYEDCTASDLLQMWM